MAFQDMLQAACQACALQPLQHKKEIQHLGNLFSILEGRGS